MGEIFINLIALEEEIIIMNWDKEIKQPYLLQIFKEDIY
jgi:hypothetical protein